MGFNWLDGFIVIAYLIAITLYGSHFRKKQQSVHTYFLGGKQPLRGPSPFPSWRRKPALLQSSALRESPLPETCRFFNWLSGT